MRRYIYNISGLILLVMILSSCKKSFLEVEPKQKLIASSVRHYDQLMNHPNFYSVYYCLPGLIMGDDVAAEESFLGMNNLVNQRAFSWSDIVFQPGQDPQAFDIQLLNLFTCNKIINEIQNVADGTEVEKSSLEAEARATRALINFEIINYYAKPYDKSTAATDPGFPIIITADITIKGLKRNSLQEVYDMMIADLQWAISKLPLAAFPTRMSRPAARGLLGKVYLFMGKYPDALQQFDLAFGDLATSASAASLYNYNETFDTNGSFLPMGRFGPNYPGNNPQKYQESILLKTQLASSGELGNTALVMSPETMELYKTGDFRLRFYSQQRSNFTPLPAGLYQKYAVQYTHNGLELADLILMRAEVRARTNNLAGAKEDVEWLRRNRMPLSDADVPGDVISSNDMLKFIIEERIREFAGEGYRWLDMRRLSTDPLFAAQAYEHKVYGNLGVSQVVQRYNLERKRLTMRLPQTIIDDNPGMINNP